METRCYGCMKLISESVCPHCGHPKDGQNEPHQLQTGTLLQGRYLVGRALAQNAGGIVYIAQDQQEDITVQLREFWHTDAKRGEDGSLVEKFPAFSIGEEMFTRQAEALSAVHILKEVSGTRDFFEENGTAYLVADSVRGPQLSRYLQLRGGKLTADETFRLLTPVLKAVAALHRAGMSHGRIHMDNIVLDPMGGARLLGFGEVFGADQAEDVYALCRLLCGCLTENNQGSTVRLSDISGLTQSQLHALEIGLSHDPQDRFASAAALERALLSQGNAQPVPPSVQEPPETTPSKPVSEMPKTEPSTPFFTPLKVPTVQTAEGGKPEAPKKTASEMPKTEPSTPFFTPLKVPTVQTAEGEKLVDSGKKISEMPKTEPATPFFTPLKVPTMQTAEGEKLVDSGKKISEMPKTEPATPFFTPLKVPAMQTAEGEKPDQKKAPQGIAPTELMTDFKINEAYVEAQKKAQAQPEFQPELQPDPQTPPADEEEIPLGALPQASVPEEPEVPQPQPPKSKKGLIIAIVAVVVLLAALAVGYFTVHIWEDATCRTPETCAICGTTRGSTVDHKYTEASCTEDSFCVYCGEIEEEAWGHSWQNSNCEEPRRCRNCGETEGTAIGHSWTDATCKAPKTCENCGATEGSALGHDWKEATYSAPKTCRRCGLTQGNVRGYYDELSGQWEALYYDYTNTYAFVLDSPLKKCKEFSIEFSPTFNYGAYVAEWRALYRDGSGVWHEIGRFPLSSNGIAYGTFTFNNPVYITAIAVLPGVSGGYSYSFDFIVVDVYTND